MAFSGSTLGRSGSVINPAPNCFRLVRRLELRVRCDPPAARLIGDEPVPVRTDVLPVRAETTPNPAPTPLVPRAVAAPAGAAFSSANPQTLQYASSITPAHPPRRHRSPFIVS